ncbi:hypothetical protein F2Q68_00016555 [Brassica cretica]|uniref:Uncharacterized protein n=1 Tax=Brassica cretica TaxID=69181 RepID=A0A8S9HJY3_BRACR|nr:hypothetical protein F2Q68_00016555 [Brassica cretica]
MGCMFSHLAAKFAFFPPSPPTYHVTTTPDGKLTAVSSSTSSTFPAAGDASLDVRVVKTRRGNKVTAFYLRNPNARLTLLYSHGNAADLGQLFDLFLQLKVNLRVNLMGSLSLFRSDVHTLHNPSSFHVEQNISLAYWIFLEMFIFLMLGSSAHRQLHK